MVDKKVSRSAIERHLSQIDCIHNYNLDIENRVIYLSSEFTWDDNSTESGTEYGLYSRFVKNMDLLNYSGSKPITIKSSNIGGDWYYGMAIFDTIRRSRSATHFYIDAYACSMGSIIPQAATKRFISEWADFLIHTGTYHLQGETRMVASAFKQQEAQTPRMYSVYAKRCVNGPFFKSKKYNEDDVAKFLEEQVMKKVDWWLTAKEAIDYGFADEIY